MSLHPNVGRAISSPPSPLCSWGAKPHIWRPILISARPFNVYGTSGDEHAPPAIIMNLARFLPHSLRVCSSVSVGLYVIAVNVPDPSPVPSSSPHSWLALWPNLFQSFKARSLVPIFTVSVPCHVGESDPMPSATPRASRRCSYHRKIRRFSRTMDNDYHSFFSSSHRISLIPVVVPRDGRDGC